eukprot:scaffold16447_cov129-Skeletonema_marinoi.AAC.1
MQKRRMHEHCGCKNKPSVEECVGGMGQRRNYAEAKGAPIELKTEESALSMEQKSNDAAVKGYYYYCTDCCSVRGVGCRVGDCLCVGSRDQANSFFNA